MLLSTILSRFLCALDVGCLSNDLREPGLQLAERFGIMGTEGCCFDICLLRRSDLENASGQCVHLYGFSPVSEGSDIN